MFLVKSQINLLRLKLLLVKQIQKWRTKKMVKNKNKDKMVLVKKRRKRKETRKRIKQIKKNR
jgi:hypothetical protein